MSARTSSSAVPTQYRMGLNACYAAIKRGGAKENLMLQGDLGTGKSSLLKMFMEDGDFKDYSFAYFDCTTKDVGDISLPDLQAVGLLDSSEQDPNADGFDKFVRFLPNEELKLHEGKPIVLMIDEFGKALPPVKNALLRLIQERSFGNTPLPEGSIVFLTTNLGAEGVGDLLKPHERNRMTVIMTRKPTADEWLEDFAIPNGVHELVCLWARENPAAFESFVDVDNPEDNPYIFHPARPEPAFVTPRSLHKASNWMHVHDQYPNEVDHEALQSLLIGTIGMRAALDFASFAKLVDQLPTMKDIAENPDTAKVPTSGSAAFLLTFKALTSLNREFGPGWFKYMTKLPEECQGMFANGVAAKKYPAEKRKIAFTNADFKKWSQENMHLFRSNTQ